MGLGPVDIHTIPHFIGGILSRIVIFPNDRIESFIIGFILHLFVELIEHNYTPSGKKIQSKINHIFDLIFYLFGWLLADYIYVKYKITDINIYLYISLSIILGFGYIFEIMREILPYNKFFRGAYIL